MKNVVVTLLLSFGFFRSSAQRVPLDQVQNYMNTTVTVCGKIYDGVFLESANDSPTLLNMGGPYPNHQLTLLIWGIKLKDFPHKPEVFYVGKEVCVTGQVIMFKGKPEIVLETPDQIKLAENTSFGLGQAPTTSPATRSTPTTRPDTVRRTTATPAAARSSTITRPDTVRGTGASTRPADPAKAAVSTSRLPATTNTPTNAKSTATTPPAVTRSATPSTTTKPVVTRPPANSIPAGTQNSAVTSASGNKPTDTTLSKDDVKLATPVPMRAGPGNNYELISQLKSGTIVTVLFSANGWSQVLIKNAKDPFSSIGYVRNSMLQ